MLIPVPWVEVFAVFLVCHLVGDYGLQTEWQARHKFGGLGPNPQARRALFAHVTVYLLAFVPAFVWLWQESGALVLGLAALLFATHVVEDDGRLLHGYVRRVKHTDPAKHPMVTVAVDQTFHVLVLFGLALLAVA
jgi:Protein of unknown function (DUF3307)